MDKNFGQILQEAISNNGIIIGFFTSITKGIFQIRKRDFSILVFFTDMFFAVIVGYVCWELVRDREMWTSIKLIFTAIMSGNAFIILSIIFNPDYFKKVFIGVVERQINIDIDNDKKIGKG